MHQLLHGFAAQPSLEQHIYKVQIQSAWSSSDPSALLCFVLRSRAYLYALES
jgi:hypothetical protein